MTRSGLAGRLPLIFCGQYEYLVDPGATCVLDRTVLTVAVPDPA